MTNSQYHFHTIRPGESRRYPGQVASGRMGEASKAYRALWAYRSRNPDCGLSARSVDGELEVFRKA